MFDPCENDDFSAEIAFSKMARMSQARCRRRGSYPSPPVHSDCLPLKPYRRSCRAAASMMLLGGASLGHSCLIFLLLVALTLSESFLILSLSLSVSILSSQADPPTLGIPYSPTHAMDAWQRGGFREAYGDPPRCSRLHGAAIGV
mgnify:CR=1 FL=1